MSQTVLILGPSGKIGTHAARAFRARGWTVRLYKRGTDMTRAALGADVIVNGLNPPKYHNWARIIPEITAQVIAAAKASGATVIVPGNVYVFGGEGGTWDEHTPHRATSRKGRIRAEMEQAYRDAGIRTIILRAGNFIDPDRNADVFSIVTLPDATKPKVGTLGHPDTLQSWIWLPDWAEAAAELAEMRNQLEAFEDVPMPGISASHRDIAERLTALTGRTYRIAGFPWWIMRVTAPFWELAREMLDMRDLYETPHRLGSAKFDRLLPGFTGTDLDGALRCILDGNIEPDELVRTSREPVLAK